MKKLLLLLTIITISLAASCHKEEETPNLHDIVRCKLNGVEWKAYDYREGSLSSFGTGATDLQYNPNGFRSVSLEGALRLEGETTSQGFNIRTPSLSDSIGKHNLSYRRKAFIDWWNDAGCKFYKLDTNVLHQMTILEIDTITDIMIGTFEFDAFNTCGDTVHITDGYFDLIYR